MTLSAEDPNAQPRPPEEPAGQPSADPSTTTAPEATGPVADAAATASEAAESASQAAEVAAGAADAAEAAGNDETPAAAEAVPVDAPSGSGTAGPPAEPAVTPPAPPAEDPAAVAAAAARAAAQAAETAQAAAARVATAPASEAAMLAAEASAAAQAASEAARIALEAARSLGATVPAADPGAASPDAPAAPGEPAGPVTHVIPMPAPAVPPRPAVGRRVLGGIAALVVGLATAFTILGLSVLVLLNPIWISSEQQRVESGTLTGFGPQELRFVTTSILLDLIVGPPDFDVQVGGTPVLNEREIGHLRDVRSAFLVFGALALLSLVVLLVARFASRGSPAFYRRIRRGARATAVGTLIVGVLGLVAFGPAFELFHRLLFPPGSYVFDPERDRLVQLFPERFWLDSTLVLGVVILVASVAFARWASSRLAGPKASRFSAPSAVATGRPAG